MAATETQVLNQVQANYTSIDKVADQLKQSLPAWKSTQLEEELRRLWKAQQYWAQEYKRVSGKDMILFKTIEISGDPNEESNETRRLAEAKLKDLMKAKTNEAIRLVHREYQTIRLGLQSQYDIAVAWQNAMFSHWVRMGVGMDAKHPLIIKKQVEDHAWPLLMEAEKLYNAGKYEKAYQKAASAGRWVKWGFDSLSQYHEKLEVGGARAVAVIKVSAALATLVVSAPVQVGVLGTMGLAALSEGAQQGTTLIAQGIDPGMTVSADDCKNAALAVAVNAGTAGLGKGLGGLVSKMIAGKAAAEIIKNTPVGEAVKETVRMKAAEFIAQRIEQYVAANAAAISNKMLGLDKSPDYNWWYMVVAPAFNGIAIEMAKEPDLQPLFKK